MKKIIQTLLLVFATSVVFAQQPCQSAFTYNDSNQGYIQFYDASYSLDSTPITVTTWLWTVTGGGASYTFTTQDPILQTNGYNGPFNVCLTIATSLGCSSTVCDSMVGNPNSGPCTANYSYQNVYHDYSFSDMSAPGNPLATVNSWSWAIRDNLQNLLYTSNQQNITFTFPAIGTYQVCLTMGTDLGCSDMYCNYVTVIDSNQQNCQINVVPVLSNVTTIGGNDGFIDLTVSGGTPPYSFYWSNGAITEDIYGLTSGVYTVSIVQADTVCPAYTYTFQIIEPYDTTIIDTLWVNPLDTCLNFMVDTFFISNIQVVQNNVIVTWVFMGGGMTGTFTVTYTFGNFGSYIVALTINCAKSTVTYMSYINITSTAGITDNKNSDIGISPNPSTGHFVVNVPVRGPGSEIQIFNNLGQLMYTSKSVNEINVIDAAQWPAGIYMVRVNTVQNHILTQKIIKQ